MPDYMSANMDPIVEAIKGIGTGLAGNALKKVQIDRQLGKDIYEAARTEAATNWDKSRTTHQNLKTQNLEDLSALFNPGALSGEERTMLGAATKLGGTSLNDVMKSVGTRHLTSFKDDQYHRGNPATQLSVAIEKPVMPYHMDADTGAVLNRMDGTSTVNQAVLAASRLINGTAKQGGGSGRAGGVSDGSVKAPRSISPTELETVFEDVIEEKDIYGNTVYRKVRNQKSMDEFVSYCQQTGLPMTSSNAMLFRAGLLGSLTPTQAQVAQSAQPQMPVMGERTAAVVNGLPAEVQAYVGALMQDYEAGKINDVEMQQLLQETGYFK